MHTIEFAEVLGKPMEVFLFAPPGLGPHPGIVLAQHIPVAHTGIDAWGKVLAFLARELAPG